MVAEVGSIDYMFSQLVLTGDVWATSIAGFILVLIILFGAIAVFGKNGVELGSFGIISVFFLGSVLATAVGLFPVIILVTILVLSLVAILIKTLFFGGNNNG